MNEESKRWFGASTLSLLLIVSILTVTYAYVEPDSWSSPSIWVQDTNTSTGILWCDDASGASGQQERELLYIGVDFDDDYLYVRWDIEQVPENIEQTYYVLVIALGSSTVTDVATHSLQFDVDRYGEMSVSIRTPNHPKFVTEWMSNPDDLSVTEIPIEAGDLYTMRTALEGRFPWSVLTGGVPVDVWIMKAQSHASASDQGWTSAVKDVIEIQDVLSPPDTGPPTISNCNIEPNIGPIGTIFAISVDVFDRSGVDSVFAYIQRPDETNIATISLTDLSRDGTYTGLWDSSGESAGTYWIDIYAKDFLDNNGEDDNVSTLTVTKISSSITSSPSPINLILGNEITVIGSLNPPLTDKTVTLTFTKPDSSTFTRTVTTNQGDYTDTYTPDMVGTWSVYTSWEGDVTHEGASSSTSSFTVHVLPVASFTYLPTTNLSIFTSINFFDLSTDLDGTIISWLWDFGDNTTSSSQNPIHMYSNKGIYTVNLTIIDNDGYVDYSSQFITIINLSPIADFTYSPERTIAEQDIIFTDLSEDPEGKNISYFWDFGDDSVSIEKNPIHRYMEYGTYTVNLTVTDDEGATNSYSTIFTIKLSSSIIFSVFPSIITVEDSVNISGSLSPSFEGIDIRLTYNMPGGPTFIRTITTGSGGIFSDSYIPDATGPWSVISSWNGNSVFEGVSSLETFAVSNISTYLSCSVSQAIIILGEEVTVAGSLSPKLIGKQLDLLFTRPDSSTLHISVLTDAVSDYTHTLIPNMPGNWSIVASWIGEDKYDQTSNSSASFTVQAAPKASFTYSPSSNSSILSLITFSDTSTDVDGTIISWLWDFGDNTSSSTQYPTHIYEDADTYSITLTVTDNDGYIDTTSHAITIQEATVAPSPVSSSITISVSVFAVPVGGSPVITSGVALGSLISVSGSIHPLISDVPVTLTYTKPDGSTFARNVTTNLGDYTDTFTPDMVGTWDVSTSWEGQAIILGASSSSESFTILQLSTSITCSVLASEVPLGSSISISGSITPPISGTTLTLTYTRPDGSTFTRTVTTNPGDYTDIYKPDVEGSWTVIASWDGDSIYDSSSSSSKSFTIKKYGCLIATATYGSELSPQVQFLRGFRDNTVLTTFAGSSFMKVFNEFYYSFSPSVASVIAENSILRDIMKVLLYPLIGILHVSSGVFSVFSFLPELGVIVAGLIASLLIGIVYFLPLALIVGLKKKLKVSEKIIHFVGIFWLSSVILLVIAEGFKAPSMMMVSTGVFVLTTISVATLILLRVVTKRMNH